MTDISKTVAEARHYANEVAMYTPSQGDIDGAGEYLAHHGSVHDDECPGDDTCDCSGKAVNDGICSVYRFAATFPHPFVAHVTTLLDDLERVTRERDELRSNVDNAVKCAKEYVPDYPWTLNTASEAVWACGEAYSGVDKACDAWSRDHATLTAKLRAAETAMEFALETITGERCGGALTSEIMLRKALASIRSPAPLAPEQIHEAIVANQAENDRLHATLRAALPPDTGGGQMATEPLGEKHVQEE